MRNAKQVVNKLEIIIDPTIRTRELSVEEAMKELGDVSMLCN